MLSLLANEDNPSEIVHHLKRSYRRKVFGVLTVYQAIIDLDPRFSYKGFHIGTWSLSDTTVIVRDLLEPNGGAARYAFEMLLDLKSKPLGRCVLSHCPVMPFELLITPYVSDGTSWIWNSTALFN